MCTMSYYKPGSAVVRRAHDPIKQDDNKTCTFLYFLINEFDEGSIL